jgi:hypothetical protein
MVANFKCPSSSATFHAESLFFHQKKMAAEFFSTTAWRLQRAVGSPLAPPLIEIAAMTALNSIGGTHPKTFLLPAVD